MKPESTLTALGRLITQDASVAHDSGVLPSELYFTDRIVVGLASSQGIQVLRTPGYKEAQKGCDFEIWLFAGERDCYWRVVLQAKRMYPTGRYDHIGYKKGQQLATLEIYARSRGAVPAYLLYNHTIPQQPEAYWHCSKCRPEAGLLGLTVVPSWRVGMALSGRGRRRFEYLHAVPGAIPFRCLLHDLDCDGKRLQVFSAPLEPESEGFFREWAGRGVEPRHLSYEEGWYASRGEFRPRSLILVGFPEEIMKIAQEVLLRDFGA